MKEFQTYMSQLGGLSPCNLFEILRKEESPANGVGGRLAVVPAERGVDLYRKISIGVPNYNRHHYLDHHAFKRALVPISLFLSFIKSTNGQVIAKGLKPTPVCQYFENRKAVY